MNRAVIITLFLCALPRFAIHAQEPATDGWNCARCVYPAGWSLETEVGGGYVSDSSFKFGDYTGLNEAGGFFVYFSWPHFKLFNVEITTMKNHTKTVGGKTYHDVKIIEAGPIANSRFYYRTIWYSKSGGVLKMFDIYNGIWTLYSI